MSRVKRSTPNFSISRRRESRRSKSLRIATEHSAAMVGAGSLLGSLEPGKLADIVLLNRNPRDDIANTLSVWKVVLGGRVFEEGQPLTANGGEDVSDPHDLHSHH
jgi:predicted amidohydrolase YtcJ